VSNLRSRNNCSETIHSLLDLIMDRMLVVERRDVCDRAKSEHVCLELQRIHKRLTDSSYKLVPAPREKTSTRIPDAVVLPETEEMKKLYNNPLFMARLPEHRGKVLGPEGTTRGHSSSSRPKGRTQSLT
jgi:hypothetical protein